MKKKKEYRYFISYTYRNKKESGFGMTTIVTILKIKSWEQIIYIRDLIFTLANKKIQSRLGKADNIIILNYTLLEE